MEKFVNQAKECNPESKGYDIVAGYCRSSPECSEILQLLDGGKRNETEVRTFIYKHWIILYEIKDYSLICIQIQNFLNKMSSAKNDAIIIQQHRKKINTLHT